MQIIYHTERLVLVPQTLEETKVLTEWKAAHEGHAFLAGLSGGDALVISDLGPQKEACREPINISSISPDPEIRLISNFSPTPFKLHGRDFASVEGFWQGLKFSSESDRRRLAQLSGNEARRAGQEQGYGEPIGYEGQTIVPGAWDHWSLMDQACRAKFSQNSLAAAALLATGARPLEHRMRRDSRTIPGVIMAGIWMRIRQSLATGRPLE